MGRLDIDYEILYQGLRIEATFSPKVPATWEDPPEGGDLQSLSWSVEDLNEVLGWLDIDYLEEYECRALGFIPNWYAAIIDSTWDLHQVTSDHYHDA